MKKKVAIIGAGASGLIASIIASKRDCEVTIFEKSKKVGKKILASGNGRCNITNKNISIKNYHGENPNFVKDALKEFDYQKAKSFFSQIGLEITNINSSRCYPLSNQASCVTTLLEIEAKKHGVKFLFESEVFSIQKEKEKFIIDSHTFNSILIATGSLAMPNLGSSDSGYKFAKEFSHNTIETYPCLVQLISNDPDVKIASGVKVEAKIELYIENRFKNKIIGDLLFTNYGLSGSAILDISQSASKALMHDKKVELQIDLFPTMDQHQLKTLLQKRINIKLDALTWLSGIINKKLASLILNKTNIKEINHKAVHTLTFALKNLKFQITDTKGEKGAEVMGGGVDTNEINPKTMESKLQKGLFFSGEVLDIDGDCGGYNLHWAWASGYLAGKNL
jgi:predicted Rossmann fold flavoprotein